MKAVVKFAHGAEGIGLREKPIPEIGEGDVLIRVRAAGLCGSDVHIYKGSGELPLGRLDMVIGHEFAGDVVAVGARVKHWKTGDRVASDNTGAVCGVCNACIRGEPIHCAHRLGLGSDLDGGFAEYVRIGAEVLDIFPSCLVHLPDELSYEEAAILDPVANGYTAVVQHGGFVPGDSVAVVGVGPLGLACINAAKLAGALHIFAIVRSSTSQTHRQAAQKLGATMILEQETDDIAAIVREKTHGEGVATAFECAGPAKLIGLCAGITRNGGRVVRVGLDFGGAPLQLDTINAMTFRNVSLICHNGYNPLAWRYCVDLLAAGKLNCKATITHILPLERYREGVDLMLRREAIKVIYQP